MKSEMEITQTVEARVPYKNDLEQYGYLCLTRKPKENQNSITIDREVEVVVLSVKGNTVKLGFRAPQNVKIERTEGIR